MPGPREPMMSMMSMMCLYEDLDWLRDHGALAGIAGVIRERKHQIEAGYTVQHDREHHDDGKLMVSAELNASSAVYGAAEGTCGPPECERAMARAAALAAAEIDRLTAEFSGPARGAEQ